MYVSIIMPTFNKLPRLKLTLSSLINQTYPKEKYEVIVIDDGATDGTKEFLANYSPNYTIRVIRQENKGRASARNNGMRHATGDITIFTDDDRALSPRFIEAHIDAQKKTNRIIHGKMIELTEVKFFQDPSTGELYKAFERGDRPYTHTRNRTITEQDIIHRFESIIATRNKVTSYEKMARKIIHDDISCLWMGFACGNCSLPSKWIQDVGGFDEAFGTSWGCEDLELGYRLNLQGYPFFYHDEAINYHLSHYKFNFEKEHEITASIFYQKYKDERILTFQNYVAGKLTAAELIESLIK